MLELLMSNYDGCWRGTATQPFSTDAIFLAPFFQFFRNLVFRRRFFFLLLRCLHRKTLIYLKMQLRMKREKKRNSLQINGRHLSIWHMRWHCLCLENGQKFILCERIVIRAGRSNNNKINVIRQSSLLMWNNQIECRAFDDARFPMLQPNPVELQSIVAELEIYSPHANYDFFFAILKTMEICIFRKRDEKYVFSQQTLPVSTGKWTERLFSVLLFFVGAFEKLLDCRCCAISLGPFVMLNASIESARSFIVSTKN